MIRAILNIAFALAAFWIVAGDYCLINNAPHGAQFDIGALGIGFAAQGLCLLFAFLLINRHVSVSRALTSWIASARLRAAVLVLAFAGLLFAHDPIAYGIYNAGVNNKLESARRVEAAINRCCSISRLFWK